MNSIPKPTMAHFVSVPKRTLSIITAGVISGAKKPGVALAANALLERPGFLHKSITNSHSFSRIFVNPLFGYPSVKQVWRACVNDMEDFTLVLGGDNALCYGTVAAASNKNPGVGIISVGSDMSPWMKQLLDDHRVRGTDFVQVGIPASEEDQVYMQRAGVLVVDVQEHGVSHAMTTAIQHLGNKRNGIHLSFGIGAFCKTVAPSTSSNSINMSYYDGCAIAKFIRLHYGDYFCSMDMVDINTLVGDPDEVTKTIHAARGVIEHGLFEPWVTRP